MLKADPLLIAISLFGAKRPSRIESGRGSGNRDAFFFSLLPSKSKKLFVFPISIILANVDDELEGNRVVAIN